MKFLFVTLAAALFFSNYAVAQEVAEPRTEEQSLLRVVPKNLEDRFSYDVHYQGMGSQSGLGFAFETPFAWNFIALRLGISTDRIHSSLPNSSDFRFNTLQVALKIQGDLETTSQIYPYVLVAYDSFIASDSAEGSKHAFGAMFGADWRFVGTPVFQKNIRTVRAFFVEGGAMFSDFRSANSYGSVSVSDGFMSRIGIRQYF